MLILKKFDSLKLSLPLVILAIFLLTRVLTLLGFAFFPGAMNNDLFHEYWHESTAFLDQGMKAFGQSAYIEPLLPMFMGFARNLLGDNVISVFLLRSLISSVSIVYFYFLCLKLCENRYVAFLAALIFIFYPYYLRISVKVTEVPLLRTLLVISSYYFVASFDRWKNSGLLGLFLGLSVMLRCMVMPAAALVFVYFALTKKFKHLALAFSVFILVLAPMFAAYYKNHGVLIPTRGGINFYLGNNELYSRFYPLYHVDLLESWADAKFEAAHPDRAGDLKLRDRFHYQQAWIFIKNSPGKFLKNKIKNFFLFFDPWLVPRNALGRYYLEPLEDGGMTIRILSPSQFPLRGVFAETIHAAVRSALLILGFMGMWARRKFLRCTESFFLFLFVTFLAVNTLFWPSTRLYAPMMFIFMYYAAYALYHILMEVYGSEQKCRFFNNCCYEIKNA